MPVLRTLSTYWRLFGRRGVVFAVSEKLSRRPTEVAVAVPGLAYPIHLRLNTSDISTYRQVFGDSEYEFALTRVPRVIIDAGANVGLASIFFMRKYPLARIFAIEPESSNFVLLQKNVAPYPNIVPIRAALWEANRDIDLVDPGLGHWGFQVSEDRSGLRRESVPGLTVDRVLI